MAAEPPAPQAQGTTDDRPRSAPVATPPESRHLNLVLGAFVVVAIFALFISFASNGSSATAQTDPAGDHLDLLSMTDSEQYGYATVTGEVQNVSGAKLDNVMAHVTWLTADDKTIDADDALIELTALMPEQRSAFKVTMKANPAMSKYRIAFKLIGGAPLNFRRSDK